MTGVNCTWMQMDWSSKDTGLTPTVLPTCLLNAHPAYVMTLMIYRPPGSFNITVQTYCKFICVALFPLLGLVCVNTSVAAVLFFPLSISFSLSPSPQWCRTSGYQRKEPLTLYAEMIQCSVGEAAISKQSADHKITNVKTLKTACY